MEAVREIQPAVAAGAGELTLAQRLARLREGAPAVGANAPPPAAGAALTIEQRVARLREPTLEQRLIALRGGPAGAGANVPPPAANAGAAVLAPAAGVRSIAERLSALGIRHALAPAAGANGAANAAGAAALIPAGAAQDRQMAILIQTVEELRAEQRRHGQMLRNIQLAGEQILRGMGNLMTTVTQGFGGVMAGIGEGLAIGRRTLQLSENAQVRLRNIQHGVGAIYRRISNGDPNIFRDLILNEWFMLVVIFITHPYIPVTTEYIGVVLLIVQTINLTERGIRLLSRREAFIITNANPTNWVLNIYTNPGHALAILFFLLQQWTTEHAEAMRAGIPPPYHMTSVEPLIASIVQNGFATAIATLRGNSRASNLNRIRITSPAPRYPNIMFTPTMSAAPSYGVPRDTQQGWITRLTAMIAGLPSAVTRRLYILFNVVYTGTIQTQPLAADNRALFILTMAQYLAGTLWITTMSGVRRVIALPEYHRQLINIGQVEVFMHSLLIQFILSVIYAIFGDVIDLINRLFCNFICYIKTITDNFRDWSMFEGSTWVTGTLKAFVQMVAAHCNCGTAGGSRSKSRRKSKHRTIRSFKIRNPTKKLRKKLTQRGGDISTKIIGEFTALKFKAMFLYITPYFSGDKIKPDNDILTKIEKIGSKIIAILHNAGEYNPPIFFESTPTTSKLLM